MSTVSVRNDAQRAQARKAGIAAIVGTTLGWFPSLGGHGAPGVGRSLVGCRRLHGRAHCAYSGSPCIRVRDPRKEHRRRRDGSSDIRASGSGARVSAIRWRCAVGEPPAHRTSRFSGISTNSHKQVSGGRRRGPLPRAGIRSRHLAVQVRLPRSDGNATRVTSSRASATATHERR